MKSFIEFFTEMNGDSYDKYIQDAHRKDHELWLKRFKASDPSTRARIQARIDKLGRGVDTATDLKLKKKKG